MKVTVCFGETKVVVPCGHGEFLVRELIEKAITRFKKAACKTGNSLIIIKTLKNLRDGGILDLDDILSDVADDREQIIAEYDELLKPSEVVPLHHGGDGTSGTSSRSDSPDVFLSPIAIRKAKPPAIAQKPSAKLAIQTKNSDGLGTSFSQSNASISSVTAAEPSESADGSVQSGDRMNRNGTGTNGKATPKYTSVQFRMLHEATNNAVIDSRMTKSVFEQQPVTNLPDSEPPHLSSHNSFKGAQINRQEPLGKPGSPGEDKFENILPAQSSQSANPPVVQKPQAKLYRDDLRRKSVGPAVTLSAPPDLFQEINLANTGGPLGIHVVPYQDEHSGEKGLRVHGLEPGGRVANIGLIKVNDVIVEINGRSILKATFERAQEIFREGLLAEELRLKIRKSINIVPPGVYGARLVNTYSVDNIHNAGSNRKLGFKPHNQSSNDIPLATANTQGPSPFSSNLSKAKSVSQIYEQRVPDSPKDDHSDDQSLKFSDQNFASNDQTNYKKRLRIDLIKGPEGLGFTITSKDNIPGASNAIFVKNILPKGAAIIDLRLNPGDQLLEVNGVSMEGKNQDEVVAVLRNLKRGSTVSLLVIREDKSLATSLPRQLPEQSQKPLGSISSVFDLSSPVTNTPLAHIPPTEHINDRCIQILNIPLNETGSAGLGVSVKGKTTTVGGVVKDLGIFIKSVLHGGAASKDGRLHVNDQLLAVNNIDLREMTNATAMETLRLAMQSDGPTPGHIKLCIARRLIPFCTASTSDPVERSDSSNSSRFSENHSFTKAPKPDVTLERKVESTGNQQRYGKEATTQNNQRTSDESVFDGKVLDLRTEAKLGVMNHEAPIKPMLTSLDYSAGKLDLQMIEQDSYGPPIVVPLVMQRNPSMKRIDSDSSSLSADNSTSMELQEDNAQLGSVDTFDRKSSGRQSFSEKHDTTGRGKEIKQKVLLLRKDQANKESPMHEDSDLSSNHEERLQVSVKSDLNCDLLPGGAYPNPMSSNYFNVDNLTSIEYKSRSVQDLTTSIEDNNSVERKRPVPAPRKSFKVKDSEAQINLTQAEDPALTVIKDKMHADTFDATLFLTSFLSRNPDTKKKRFSDASIQYDPLVFMNPEPPGRQLNLVTNSTEKSIKRKSELLKSSPYPNLYNVMVSSTDPLSFSNYSGAEANKSFQMNSSSHSNKLQSNLYDLELTTNGDSEPELSFENLHDHNDNKTNINKSKSVSNLSRSLPTSSWLSILSPSKSSGGIGAEGQDIPFDRDTEASRRSTSVSDIPTQISRTRECNSSFRTAVDKSYESTMASSLMSTVDSDKKSNKKTRTSSGFKNLFRKDKVKDLNDKKSNDDGKLKQNDKSLLKKEKQLSKKEKQQEAEKAKQEKLSQKLSPKKNQDSSTVDVKTNSLKIKLENGTKTSDNGEVNDLEKARKIYLAEQERIKAEFKKLQQQQMKRKDLDINQNEELSKATATENGGNYKTPDASADMKPIAWV